MLSVPQGKTLDLAPGRDLIMLEGRKGGEKGERVGVRNGRERRER